MQAASKVYSLRCPESAASHAMSRTRLQRRVADYPIMRRPQATRAVRGMRGSPDGEARH